jgi:Ca-activated chloride channel homolog
MTPLSCSTRDYMLRRRWNLIYGVLPLFWINATFAQTPSAQTPTSQTIQSPRSLSVDRDPSPSIDPDTVTPTQPGPAPAANVGPVAKDETGRYTLEAEAYEVQLNVSVLDSTGRPAENLTKAGFHVFEGGVPQIITGFRHEDVAVSIGLLVDSSASMYDKRAAVEQAFLDLVRLSNSKDEEFLVDFSSKAYIDQDFTSSVDKLHQGLRYVNSTGGTAAYDAVMASATYLSKHAKNNKKVLLLITDGEDNASRTTMAQMIRRVQDLDGPIIYCVGLLFGEDTDKLESRRARTLLEQMATQTGGAAFFPRSIKEVDQIASIVAADIRTQYILGYRSTNPPSNGGYRTVHVDAFGADRQKLNVRTRTGYLPKAVPVAAAR